MGTNTYITSREGENISLEANFTYILSKTEILEFEYSPVLEQESLAEESIEIPVIIFQNGHSGLEAISKYLKENIGLKYCEIARILGRDDRTIWHSYKSATTKCGGSFLEDSGVSIPISVFSKREFSILESLVYYLKEELCMRHCKIAGMLRKDQRTIWTAHNRAKNKLRIKQNG